MSDVFQRIEAHLWRHHRVLLWVGYGATILVSLWRVLVALGAQDVPPYHIQDWLLNYGDGPVRRGLSGEAVIAAAQLVGGHPAVWAWALAALATGALVALVVAMVRKLPDNRALVPLVLAPWGLLFFAYDWNGSLRKEVLGYLVLAMILTGATSASQASARRWLWAAVIGFLAALFAHEAIALLGPALLLACALLVTQHPGLRGEVWGLAATAFIASFAAILWMLQLPLPTEPERICEAAGMVRCEGPFEWLSKAGSAGMAYVISRRDWIDLPIYAVYIALAFVPLLGVQVSGWTRGRHWRLGLALFLSISPLFLVGYDWGRWVQMGVLPMALLAFGAMRVGLASYRRVLPGWLAVIYVGSWAMPHADAVIWPMGLVLLAVLGVITLGHGIFRGKAT